MKFDIVVGNPPYQNPNSSAQKLWPKFLRKMIELSNGYVLAIVPELVAIGASQKMRQLRDFAFLQNHLCRIDFSKFNAFDIGETVCLLTISTTHDGTNGRTIVVDRLGNEKTININSSDIIPNSDDHAIQLQILDKVFDSNKSKIQLVSEYSNPDSSATVEQLINRGLISERKTSKFSNDFYHTASQKFFTCEANAKLRVMLNFSGGYFDPLNADRYMPITMAVLGKQVEGVPVQDMAEGLRVRKYLSSKIIRYAILCEKNGGFNTGIFKIPHIDFSIDWSDTELYQYFNLTQEEIDLIESTVKDFI